MPFTPPPPNAPHWAQELYWVILVMGLLLVVLAPLGARALVSISRSLKGIRYSNHEIANTAQVAAGNAQYNGQLVEQVRGMFNGNFDERMQSNVRAVLGDPVTAQMFIASYQLQTRQQIEQIAAAAAELAVSSHERRVHVTPIHGRDGHDGADGHDGDKGDKGDRGDRGDRGDKGNDGDGRDGILVAPVADKGRGA